VASEKQRYIWDEMMMRLLSLTCGKNHDDEPRFLGREGEKKRKRKKSGKTKKRRTNET